MVDDESELRHRLTAGLAGPMPGARVVGLQRLSGGNSSLTYLIRVAVDGAVSSLVVKTIPTGLTAVRNRDIVRQGRVMEVLSGAGLPVTEPLVIEPGAPPAAPPYLVSRFVEGDSFDPTSSWSDSADLVDQAVIEARALEMMHVLARLQGTDPDLLPTDQSTTWSLSGEVSRWQRALRTTEYAEDPVVHRCLELLEAHLPVPGPGVLVHGDYRLGNVLCSGITVGAVIDWEIWSVGDPRFDLAWFAVRAFPSHPAYRPERHLPPVASLVDAYVASGGQDPVDMPWFFALAAFKNAAVSALIDKRGGARRDANRQRVPRLLRWTLDQLELFEGENTQ